MQLRYVYDVFYENRGKDGAIIEKEDFADFAAARADVETYFGKKLCWREEGADTDFHGWCKTGRWFGFNAKSDDENQLLAFIIRRQEAVPEETVGWPEMKESIVGSFKSPLRVLRWLKGG